MALAIGFGGKFYTLWDIEKDIIYSTINTANGEYSFPSYEKFSCVYIKNISFDIEKVKSLYPNLEICEDLKGKNGSFDYIKLPVLDSIYINKGRNRGKLISELTNKQDLYYSYSNERDEERVANIVNRMQELGFVYYENHWYDSQTEVDNIVNNQNKYNDRINFYKTLENGGSLEIVLDRNLSQSGTIIIDNILYRFVEYKEMYYNGYNYALPMQNGKGKKVKGKTLKLNVNSIKTEYDDYELLVNSFEILD